MHHLLRLARCLRHETRHTLRASNKTCAERPQLSAACSRPTTKRVPPSEIVLNCRREFVCAVGAWACGVFTGLYGKDDWSPVSGRTWCWGSRSRASAATSIRAGTFT
jgi:hypothetical protein